MMSGNGAKEMYGSVVVSKFVSGKPKKVIMVRT